MQRVLVLGICGSGKSSLARRLGRILDLEVIHLDQYYWRPGWIETPQNEWNRRLTELLERDRWIMDGNYSTSIALRIASADTIIVLELDRYRALLRVLLRVWRERGRTRADMATGCNERLDMGFLWYVWRFNDIQKVRIEGALREGGNGKRIVRLGSRAQADAFLADQSGTANRNDDGSD